MGVAMSKSTSVRRWSARTLREEGCRHLASAAGIDIGRTDKSSVHSVPMNDSLPDRQKRRSEGVAVDRRQRHGEGAVEQQPRAGVRVQVSLDSTSSREAGTSRRTNQLRARDWSVIWNGSARAGREGGKKSRDRKGDEATDGRSHSSLCSRSLTPGWPRLNSPIEEPDAEQHQRRRFGDLHNDQLRQVEVAVAEGTPIRFRRARRRWPCPGGGG